MKLGKISSAREHQEDIALIDPAGLSVFKRSRNPARSPLNILRL
jgi:hypothetical protein